MDTTRDQRAEQRTVRAHGFVRGRVQGVWFRDSTRERAIELGLGGWVRNLPDGRVEAEFVGSTVAVRQAVEFVRRGPPHARVDEIEGFEIDELPEPASSQRLGFRIL